MYKKPVHPKDLAVVECEVKAIAEGYYQNKIVRPGEKFTYRGGLNRVGSLPLWVEALGEMKLISGKLPGKAEAALEDTDTKVALAGVKKVSAPKKAKTEKGEKKTTKKAKVSEGLPSLPKL